MLIQFLCTKKEYEVLEAIHRKMEAKRLNGEQTDFMMYMEEIDKHFKDMDMLHVLANLRETLRKIKAEEEEMQTGYL